MHRITTHAACLLGVSLPFIIGAEEALPPPAVEDPAPITVTATRLPGATTAGSQTLHEVGPEDTRLVGEHTTPLDTIDRLPGVFTIAGLGGGLGGTTILSLRGTGTADTLLLVDGIPLGDPTATNGQFPLGALPLSATHIAVLKGVQPLYGSRAVGGVVDQRTARPSAEPEQFLRLEAGSFAQVLGQAQATGPIGERWGYAVTASGYDTEGISAQTAAADGRSAGEEKDGFTRLDGSARLEYRQDWGTLALSLLGIDVEHDFDAFGDPEATTERNEHATLRGALGAELTPAENWTVVADLALTRYDKRITYTDFFSSLPVSDDYQADELWAAARARYEPDAHWALSLGADLLRQEGAFPDQEDELQTTGVWGRAAWRREVWEFDATLRGEFHSDTEDVVTWRLGAALWLWEDRSRVHASLGTGFRSPTLFDLNDPFFGNPDLDPERSLAWEIGHDSGLLPGLTLSNVAFRTDFEDKISFDPVTFVSINLSGDSVAQGVESQLRWEPPEGQTRLVVSHTYLDAEDDEGDTPTFKPRNTVGLAATWFALERRVWATLTIDWVDRYRVFGGEIAERTLAGLAAGWQIDDRFTVHARIRNLFDVAYQPNIGFAGEPLNAVVGVTAAF